MFSNMFGSFLRLKYRVGKNGTIPNWQMIKLSENTNISPMCGLHDRCKRHMYLALLVAAARVLCTAYISVSTPAMLSVSLTHRLTVSLETGL